MRYAKERATTLLALKHVGRRDEWRKMPKGFPTCSYKKLLGIVEKYSDGPLRSNGSHHIYRSQINGRSFSFPRRKKDFKTATVRDILVKQLGLTIEQALKEVR